MVLIIKEQLTNKGKNMDAIDFLQQNYPHLTTQENAYDYADAMEEYASKVVRQAVAEKIKREKE